MGGAAKSIGRVAKVVTPINYIGARMGQSLIKKQNPIENVAKDYGLGGAMGFGGSDNPYIAGPFSLDMGQLEGDKAAITEEGQRQYDETLSGIDKFSQANTKRAAELFAETLPDIAENAQAAHLYDSTGYGQEVARAQKSIASDVANREAEARFNALAGKQGFDTGALQRGLSLEDFINQSNVAKTIGAQMAPIPQNGKQNFGTVAQGVGALAPWGKMAMTGK